MFLIRKFMIVNDFYLLFFFFVEKNTLKLSVIKGVNVIKCKRMKKKCEEGLGCMFIRGKKKKIVIFFIHPSVIIIVAKFSWEV